jgi:hypothetical protein
MQPRPVPVDQLKSAQTRPGPAGGLAAGGPLPARGKRPTVRLTRMVRASPKGRWPPPARPSPV